MRKPYKTPIVWGRGMQLVALPMLMQEIVRGFYTAVTRERFLNMEAV